MYKNIVIFGEPAAGKTTIAKELAAKILNFKIIEASRGLIFPITYYFKELPRDSEILISRLKQLSCKKLPKYKITREKAREIFSSLRKQYHPSFIAEALDKLYSERYPKNPLIFTGVRGYENAEYFKELGYLVVFLKAEQGDILERLVRKRAYSNEEALKELEEENRLYSTEKIEGEADLIFNTSTNSASEITRKITENLSKKPIQECKKCINTNQNPAITINEEGYCNICETYMKNFDPNALAKEVEVFKSFKGTGKGKYDIMVGLSGGKDSSATLYQIKQMGFTPLAFTFDTGCFPPYIYERARKVAEMCGVDYEIIPVKQYLTPEMLERFQRMAELYKRNKKEEFVEDYLTGRQGYRGVVRPCWVCRELIIHGRYFEALKHGVRVVAIGINEWTSLKQTTSGGKFTVSAIRKLDPFSNEPDKPAVNIVHFPFLMRRKLKDTKKILKKMGWDFYDEVQSNAESCSLARAAEKQLYKNLGFHPDTTRLAREVTCGFLTKQEAKEALREIKKCEYTIPQILKKANLIYD